MTGFSSNLQTKASEASKLPHAESPQWLEFVRAASSPARVPGVQDWWMQEAAEARTQIIRSGFPTTKQEDWKYTSLMPLHGKARRLSMGPVDVRGDTNGLHVFTLSQLSASIAAGANPKWGDTAELKDLESRIRKLLTRRDLGFGSELCRSFVEDPFVLKIGPEYRSERPIEIMWKSLPSDQWSLGMAIIDVAAGVNATLVESYGGGVDSQTNQTMIDLKPDSNVSHLRIQRGTGGVVLATSYARLARNAKYHAVQISSGSALSREDLYVEFIDKHSLAITDGVFVGQSGQVLDHHTNLLHHVGDTQSQQLYKGVLADESRGVFNGRVVISNGASGSNSSQLNKNLLLSKRVEIDTKPQLEIENDDVKAAHGAAIGRLDKEHLFYLRSRGISESQAVEVLARGFALEAIDKLDSDQLRARGRAAIDEALTGLRWEEA